MSINRPLYSERQNGPVPRTHDDLPERTRRGLVALVESRVADGSLAEEFPERCTDYGYTYGTDARLFAARAAAEVNDLESPLAYNVDAPDEVIFDLVEYVGDHVQHAQPRKGQFHPHFRHYPLTFTREPGRAAYRTDVNRVLERGGTTFELDTSMRIVRVGSEEVQHAADALQPDTGDSNLDTLLLQARRLYRSRSVEERKHGIDTLWDAFERLKTIDIPEPRKKAQSTTQLLSTIPAGAFREIVEAEMRDLTLVGNQFRIRHHEADKHDVPIESYDYLYMRLTATILLLLRFSGRLAGDND